MSSPVSDSRRYPVLKGGINFRDFGGYETAGGSRVKWGKLYRSGVLSRLTEECHAALDRYDIAAICDFRTEHENGEEPTRLPPHLHANVRRLNIWPKASRTFESIVADLHRGQLTVDDMLAQQFAVYREFIVDFADRYADMFAHIMAARGRSVLIHCKAGKDRTGIGAALIHLALGVSDEAMRQEYMLTNADPAGERRIQSVARNVAAEMGITDAGEIERLRTACWEVYRVRQESLAVALAGVSDLAGSLDGFFTHALKLSPADRARLAEWYVEPA